MTLETKQEVIEYLESRISTLDKIVNGYIKREEYALARMFSNTQLTLIDVLEDIQENTYKANINKRPKNSKYNTWTKSDTTKCLQMHKNKTPYKIIAKRLNRNVEIIKSKISYEKYK